MTDARHDPSIRIGSRFQGPTGSGQGGWTAQRFAEHIPVPVTTAIKAPIPLDTDLSMRAAAGRWELVDPEGLVIMEATTWEPAFADTDPVPIDEARAARGRFAAFVPDHPAPYCFSCGVQHDSMNVHAAPIGDDRVATDWTLPDWTVRDDGTVDPGPLWAAIDCCAAWWVGFTRDHRLAYTAQYAVEEVRPLEPGATYALVGWAGDHDPEWDGRKRYAASAAFDVDGRCVARSVSLWIAARTH